MVSDGDLSDFFPPLHSSLHSHYGDEQAKGGAQSLALVKDFNASLPASASLMRSSHQGGIASR